MPFSNPRVRNAAATLAVAASISFAAQAQDIASTLASGTSLSSIQGRPVLSQHVPQIVKSGHASRIAALGTSEPLQLVLSLPLRNQDALTALLADLYNPASPSYHQWLQPAQFDAQFGPTAADYQTLISWARGNGFDIVAKSGNHRVLTIQGSTGLVNRAFHITETRYHDETRNRDFRAPDREPTTDLSVPLLAISGLETSNPRVNHHLKAPDADIPRYVALRDTGITSTASLSSEIAGNAATVVSKGIVSTSVPGGSIKTTVQPRATGSGPSGTFIPSDMRAAYYGSGSLTGAGQNVDIFSYDGYLSNDISLWYSDVGVTPSTVPVTNVLTGGFDGGCELDNPCDDGEQVLDILQVQGMAPGLSHIYFYEGLSAVTELNQMVSDNYAPVITSSWGGGDFGPGTEPALLQMAAQGQTYLNATGDDGAFNGFTYLPPSSSVNILQVGGTDLTTASAGGAWSAETGWADSGGGFFDPNITIPTWQQTSGVITSTNAGSTTLRNSPDIAAEANFDNTLVSNGSLESGYGGTSYATPRMAGYLALANQQSAANGTGRLGFLNPTIYQLGLSSQATYFHDITSGKNTASSYYNGVKAAFNAVAGYDLVTGWGSPNGPALLNALIGPSFSFASGTSALTIARSNSGTVNFTVTPLYGFTGTPTFTVAGLPTGVTGTVGSIGTNSYSLPLTVSSTATIGTASITVTATYGSISQTATFALTVGKRAGYDFTISATSVSTPVNTSVVSKVTVVPGSGYDGPVDLTVSGVPTGVTTQFGTPSTFSTSNLLFIVSTSAAPGTYTVTVTGTAAGVITHSTPITLTIASPASALLDGGFEQQSGTIPWVFTSTTAGSGYECNQACGFYQHGGSYFAYINGFGATDTDTLSQTFTIPVVNTAILNFWLMIGTAETSTTAANDTLTVTITPSGGTAVTVATFSNLNKVNPGAYVQHSYDLSSYRGQTVTLTFTGKENSSRATAFLIDDVSLVTQ